MLKITVFDNFTTIELSKSDDASLSSDIMNLLSCLKTKMSVIANDNGEAFLHFCNKAVVLKEVECDKS